ncbi:hypothetical protein JCM30204_00670 [Dysgonomonas termitidis]
MQEGQIVNLNLLKKGDRLIVSLMPKVQDMPGSAIIKLIPLNVSGTPTELDQGFLEAISQPLQERLGLLTNVDAFRENTKVATSKKTQVTTTNAAKDTKTSKSERMLADAEVHEKAGRWPEAYAIYKKVSAADPDNIKLKEKVMEVWSKMAQRPLFEPEEDEIQVEAEDTLADPSMEDDSDEETEEEEIDDEESEDLEVTGTGVPEQDNISSQPTEQAPVDMFAQIMGIAKKIG